MKRNRRSFLELLAGAAAAIRATAPGTPVLAAGAQGKRELGAALEELNTAAAIGIAPGDFREAIEYATGAYGDIHTRLRAVTLDDSLDLPVAFHARARRR